MLERVGLRRDWCDFRTKSEKGRDLGVRRGSALGPCLVNSMGK